MEFYRIKIRGGRISKFFRAVIRQRTGHLSVIVGASSSLQADLLVGHCAIVISTISAVIVKLQFVTAS